MSPSHTLELFAPNSMDQLAERNAMPPDDYKPSASDIKRLASIVAP